jgi:leucyl-tRNA synthetase
MGGIEEGETEVEAGEREIREESGYKNFKFIRYMGSVQSEFFAAHKDLNRVAHTRELLFELVDEEREEISEEEKDIHDLEWRTWEEIQGPDMTHSEMQVIIERMHSGYQGYSGEGVLFNSGKFTRMKSEEARNKIAEEYGEKVTKYKLRDWLVSRQRYWGCPIPIVYDPENKPHPVPEEHLPWILPEDNIDFTPKGTSPLGSSKELLERTEKIFGKGWKPELDTMDTFVDSSWYFIAYCIKENIKSETLISKQFQDEEIKNKLGQWLPVDRYSGGAEHTTMHLLYSRFFYKALFDMGLVNEQEPFKERMNRGLILGPDGQKMSKSKGNVIDPDDHVEMVGADTVRMYLAFIGPYNEVGQYPWDLGGIAGTRRFLERIWKLRSKIGESENTKLTTLLHKTIKKVTGDIENYKFNTAISSMMILVNEMDKIDTVSRQNFEVLLKILAPFAPHMTEEIWHSLQKQTSIHLEKWPMHDDTKIEEGNATIVVQINGKVRATFESEKGTDEEYSKEKALNLPEIQRWLGENKPKKIIFIPNKLINIVL